MKQKKILILGGANQHLKIVEAAHEMGLYSIVVDYLTDSPAKRICDESILIDIKDTTSLAELCNKKNVSGVVAGFLDPCQIPYYELCNRLSLPCLGTKEQFSCFTNKQLFKQLCRKNGVKVINDYSIIDIVNDAVKYPIFIKPVDSRGSRGQTVCYNQQEALAAIRFAQNESSNGEILIEDYMGNCDEFQVTYFVINGKIYLERTVDSYRGSEEQLLHKVVNCSISPSRYTQIYLETTHPLVTNMIRKIGIKNGPVFMQGFIKDNQFYFFDPGLRFPGVEFERIYEKVFGINFPKLLIHYALYGQFPNNLKLPEDGAMLNGMKGAILFPVVKPGIIKAIVGDIEFKSRNNIIAYVTRYKEADIITKTNDVNQRYAEIDILGNNINEIYDCIFDFQQNVHILNEQDEQMLYDPFDLKLLQFHY